MNRTSRRIDEVCGPRRTMLITASVVEAIRQFIGEHPAERGGMLGCDADGVIRHFVPDTTGRMTAGAYDPDIETLNAVIKKWKLDGIRFVGFVHSHPDGFLVLSSYDVWYAGEILSAFKKLDSLYLPLVMTVPDTGTFEIIPFVAIPCEDDRTKCAIVKARLKVVVEDAVTHPDEPARGENVAVQEMTSDVSEKAGLANVDGSSQQPQRESRKYHGHFGRLWSNTDTDKGKTGKKDIFSQLDDQEGAERQRDKYLVRLSKSYDIRLLDQTRLVIIGTGGVAALIRNAARMGYGEFILIDPDIIDYPNIASQQAPPDAIGQFKVEQLASDVTRINPASMALAVAEAVEQIDDSSFHRFFTESLRGLRADWLCQAASAGYGGPRRMVVPRRMKTILLVMTDNFRAQARGHRLGLNFGLPTICAQEYAEGRGAEVTYTVPGITPACHRCITASRYRSYLDEGYSNTVTSEGAPIFAAEFLNAVLGHVLLALTHHGSDHPRWGKMVEKLGNRNLIRLRMDPDFDTRFGNTFQKRHAGAVGLDSLFMLDTLFLSQTPDCGQSKSRPVCPDCGGNGDLRSVIGTFPDTRMMREA